MTRISLSIDGRDIYIRVTETVLRDEAGRPHKRFIAKTGRNVQANGSTGLQAVIRVLNVLHNRQER